MEKNKKELSKKSIVKQDNGQMVVVNRKKKNSSGIPSEWNSKPSTRDINKINKKIKKR